MDVRVLLGLRDGTLAHFQLDPGWTGRAVRHRTVEEIWYVLSGRGRLWRSLGDDERIDAVAPGACVDLPVGTAFQLRAEGEVPLCVVAVTMPPWPGAHEAVGVRKCWKPSLPAARGARSRQGRRRSA